MERSAQRVRSQNRCQRCSQQGEVGAFYFWGLAEEMKPLSQSIREPVVRVQNDVAEIVLSGRRGNGCVSFLGVARVATTAFRSTLENGTQPEETEEWENVRATVYF